MLLICLLFYPYALQSCLFMLLKLTYYSQIMLKNVLYTDKIPIVLNMTETEI